MTDDNTKNLKGDKAYREDITGVADAYIRNGNANRFTPAEFAEEVLSHTIEENGRGTTPEAFLLNRADAKYLLKANNINLNVWANLLLKAPNNAVMGEIPQEVILQGVEEAFKAEKIALSRLKKIVGRASGQNYWYYRIADLLLPKEENGQKDFETVVVIIVNGVVQREYPLEGKGNEILFARDPIERGTLAEVPEGYKYFPYSEYSALEDIKNVIEALTKADTVEQIVPSNFYSIPSDPVISALSSVRTRTTAVELPSFGGGKIVRYATANGQKVQIADDTTAKGKDKPLTLEEITRAISNPNVGKLLDYAISKSVENGLAKTVRLYTDEVMILQGRTNKQSTIRAMKEAIKTMRSLEIITVDRETKRESNYGLVQEYDFPPQGAPFNPDITFSDKLYNAMQNATSYVQLSKKLQGINNTLAWRIARAVYEHKRVSLEKENEEKLSMQKIMEYCDLTRDVLKDKGQTKQLIINPILTAFEEIDDRGLFWVDFRKPRNKKLTEEEQNMIYEHTVDYDLFEQLVIIAHFEPEEEPNYDKARKGKRRYIERAKKKKKAK